MGSLEYLIDHIFLPPKLPHQDDSSVFRDRLVTEAVHDALHSISCLDPVWPRLSKMLTVLLGESREGAMPATELEHALLAMDNQGKYSLALQAAHC